MTTKKTSGPASKKSGRVVSTTARVVHEPGSPAPESAGTSTQAAIPPAEGDYYVRWRVQLRDWVREKNVPPKWADLILLLPDFTHLLVKLLIDGRVPVKEKLLIGGSIAYFALPIDLAAEMLLGPIGYLDDILLAIFVVDRIVNRIEPEIIRQHWAGDGDILDTLRKATDGLQELLGPRFTWRFGRLLGWLNSSGKNRGSQGNPG